MNCCKLPGILGYLFFPPGGIFVCEYCGTHWMKNRHGDRAVGAWSRLDSRGRMVKRVGRYDRRKYRMGYTSKR